jgi:hypothetical protein
MEEAMKRAKKHLLRALAAAAEESVEETLAEASGYANADVMRAALTKALFSHPKVKLATEQLHQRAAKDQAPPKLKPRAREISKLDGHVQAPRLKPRKHG